MKYDINSNHGHVPWFTLVPENETDQKALKIIEKHFVANNARFNASEFKGNIINFSFQLAEDITGKAK